MDNLIQYADAVKAIKTAIVRCRYRSLAAVNSDVLSLYFGVGKFVSQNTRGGKWGQDAIGTISKLLQKELPGLRGFSESGIKRMRSFYEEWAPVVIHPTVLDEFTEANFRPSEAREIRPLVTDEFGEKTPNEIRPSVMGEFTEANFRSSEAGEIRPSVTDEFGKITQSEIRPSLMGEFRPSVTDELQVDEKMLISSIDTTYKDFDWTDFLKVSFTHHSEIIAKVKSLEARLFYIHQAAIHSWSVATLKNFLREGLYEKRGTMPSNFFQTLPDAEYAAKAVMAFKDEYLLDMINVENVGEREEDWNERVIERQIVDHIRDFILKFGEDFYFVGSQHRLVVADEEMFADLVFFNRELNATVVVELKRGKFRPNYLGQLSAYLAAYDATEKKPHENPSIGIVLCHDANMRFVEFLVRAYDQPMGVATYRTADEMPERLRRTLPDMEKLTQVLCGENPAK